MSKRPKSQRSAGAGWSSHLLTLAAALAILQAHQASAATYNYTGATGGSWNVAGNWTLAGGGTQVVPGNGDNAQLGVTGTTASSVVFNMAYTGAGLNSLTIDAQVPTTMTLNQTSSTSAMIATTETIGNTIFGNFYTQSAGTNTATTIILGNQTGSYNNFYTLSGGTVTAGTLTVGNSGTGSVIQSGGTVTVTTSLVLAAASGGSGSYTLSGTGILNAAGETVAENGTATSTFTQTGGTNTVNGGFGIGGAANSNGTYALSATGALIENAGAAVGLSGTGTFTQTGGTNTVASGNLNIGYNSGAIGTYNLSSGTVTVTSGNVYVSGGPPGHGGTGYLIVSGGGILSTSGTANITLYNSAGSGLTLSGGTINTGSLNIPSGNTALFTWTGGTLNWNSTTVNAIVDSSSSANLASTLTLGSSQTLAVASSEIVGNTGTGTVNQSGSTNTIANGNLNIGNNSGSTGNYNLSGGTTTVTTGNVYVGGNSSGAGGKGILTVSGSGVLTTSNTANVTVYNTTGSGLTLSGGTINAGSLNLSGNPALFTWTSGTLNWNSTTVNAIVDNTSSANLASTLTLGTSQTLAVASTEIVGNSGTGAINQTGGNHLLAGNLTLGNSTNATGTYNLSGTGILNTNAPFYSEIIGNLGNGTFNQSGGTNTLGSGTLLYLGYSANSTGTYTLSATGSLQGTNSDLPDNNGEIIGNSGTGIFNQSGGTNTLVGIYASLTLGNNGGSTGTYTLSGGTLSVAGDYEIIGQFGKGTFNQTGGINISNVRGGGIFIGNGTYNLSGTGSLISVEEDVDGPNGTFTQTGGTNTVPTSIYIADSSGSGTYALSAGAATVGLDVFVGGDNVSGPAGAGTLTVSGSGTLTVAGTLEVFNSTGTIVNLSGGTINAGGLNFNGVPSVFNWTSGTLNITNNVTWDSGASSTSTSSAFGLSLTLGTGQTLIVTGNETLGGTGSFIMTLNSGSTHTVTRSIVLSPTGILNLAGGTINAGGLDFGGAPYLFNWMTGTLNITSNVTWDSAASNTSTSGAFGSSLSLGTGQTLMITGNETLGNVGPFTLTLNSGSRHIVSNALAINPTGTLVLNGGALNYAALTLSGGTVNGAAAIVNNATISGFGTISGSGGFTNNIMLAPSGGTLTISNTGTIINAGTIALDSGAQLALTGGSLSNTGTINLNASYVTGTALLNNTLSGTITGSGTIATPFANNGTISVTADTLTLPIFINIGDIELAGVTATLADSSITNASIIEGFGKISSSVINNGTLQPIGGTLNIAGTLTNSTSGLLVASSGTNLLISSGLATNAGLITLTGGTFDNDGHILSNTGQITGYGTIRTGGLTNNGIFTLTGGTSTVNGNVTNSASQTINIKYQPAIFTGNITNSGTIIVTSTTVTFTGTYTGNAYISDPSTNIFQNSVTIIPGGSMTGGSGDQYDFTGGTVTNNGTFANAGALQSGVNLTNAGTFTQSGPQSWTPGSTFTSNAGTANLLTDAGSPTSFNLTINVNAGAMNLTGAQHLQGLSITGGITTLAATPVLTGPVSNRNPNARVLVVNALNIAGGAIPTGKLNLNNNMLIVKGGGAAARNLVEADIAYARDGGAWDRNGITSTNAQAAHAADGFDSLTLGDILNSDLATPYTTFGGQAVGPNDVLIKFTYGGDANLNGVVNGDDYFQIDQGFVNHYTGWINGDFNHDGVVNGDDYFIIDSNFINQSGELAAPEVLAHAAEFGPSYLSQFSAAQLAPIGVPEPATLTLLGLAAAPLLRRRRRRA